MAHAAAAVHKKKPHTRLLALLALSWACLPELRAPDTLMHIHQTSQSVVKFPSIRQTAQPVRALAGPTVRPGL